MTETVTSTRPATALRRAGVWCLVTVAGIVLTPITVFAIPWSALGSQYEDPTAWRDPVVTGGLSWLGPLYGAQGLLQAASVVVAALILAEVLGRSKLATAGLAGAFGWGLMQVMGGGSGAAWYGSQIAAQLSALQPDPAIRKMIGFADLLGTQGMAGAAGIAALIWLLAVAVLGRRAGWFGRAPLVVTVVVGTLIVLSFCWASRVRAP